MTTRSRISSILELIGPERPELFIKKKIAIFDFVYSLASTIFNQSALNLAKIYNHKILDEFDYGSNRIRMTGVIYPWIRKIATFVSVYTLASIFINQWAPNLVKLYMTIRSHLSSIMAVIRLERLQLFALELEKLLYLTLFTL